jgi:hypothetical protein
VIASSAERAALERAISTDRLTTYQRAAAAAGCDVLDLYLWDRDAAAAVLADIAILEVALRNAMHNVLTAHYLREDWYASDVPLDDRSRRALVQAWERLGKDQRTPGRVVARLMFGFWSGLLDAGGHNGLLKCDYEQLFRDVLRLAFPGGPPEARADGVQFSREWVLGIVTVVHALRNRAAHHEPLVGGFPLPGQRDRHGNVTRLTVADGYASCMKLARLIDRNLATWLAGNSAVPGVLGKRP